MSKREIKVGDKVRVITDNKKLRSYSVDSKIEKGFVGIIDEIDDTNYHLSYLNGAIMGGSYVNHSWVELVEPTYTWTSKFNIGDKVVDKNGNILYINAIYFDGTNIEYYSTIGSGYYEKELELYEEPKVKEVTIAELEEQYGCKVKVVK